MKICRYFSAVLHIKQRKHHKEGLHLKKTAKLHLICTRNVGWATNWHVEPLQQTEECLQAPQRHSIYTCSTLNWNRRKWFNIEIITHLHLCNHIQGWLSIYTQFSLSHGVWLVATTHRSSETVILSQRKELYNHRAIVIVRVNLTLVVGPSSFSATQLWRLKDRSLQLTRTLFPNFSSNCFTSGSMPDKSSLYRPKYTHIA